MSGQRDGRTSGFRAPPSYLVFLLPYASTFYHTKTPWNVLSAYKTGSAMLLQRLQQLLLLFKNDVKSFFLMFFLKKRLKTRPLGN